MRLIREMAVRAARLKPPYVLVAHSTGGLVARQYTSAHPRRVAGLVLVDAMARLASLQPGTPRIVVRAVRAEPSSLR
jgi:pimeloyl-ACP methyl ester carboxylesterase